MTKDTKEFQLLKFEKKENEDEEATADNTSAETVLQAAIDNGLDRVFIIGYSNKEKEEFGNGWYFAASDNDVGHILTGMETFKAFVFR